MNKIKKSKKILKNMMKRLKGKTSIWVAVVVIAAIVAVSGFAVVNAQGASFWDKVAQYTGQYLGASITDKLDISGILEEPSFGALASPDFPTDWYKVGGVKVTSKWMTMATATTTPCALQAPSATSTLIYAAVDFAPASSTAVVSMVLAKDSTAYATTTAIGSIITIPSGVHRTIVASTTAISTTDSVDNITFEPGYYLVMSMQGAGNGAVTASPVGKCTAVWRTVSEN